MRGRSRGRNWRKGRRDEASVSQIDTWDGVEHICAPDGSRSRALSGPTIIRCISSLAYVPTP